MAHLVTQVSREKPKTLNRFFTCFCCFSKTNHATKRAKIPENLPSPNTPHTFLLPPLASDKQTRKCLVLDLDETLVHSSFTPVENPDFIISIELENVVHRVYVRKRPGVDEFLRAVGAKFEIVVFTASLNKYADPLLDILDRDRVVQTRLFREACVVHFGNYVKDLSHLGRAIEQSIIIDNSPYSYMFQPENAIPISSWFEDKSDRELYDLLPFLDSLVDAMDVRVALQQYKMTRGWGNF
jgi:RNA polymerase II subunit A small phosphatase-like protein